MLLNHQTQHMPSEEKCRHPENSQTKQLSTANNLPSLQKQITDKDNPNDLLQLLLYQAIAEIDQFLSYVDVN